MAVLQAGVSTLGVKLGYAVGGASAPSSVTWLERCNSIGGISLSVEQIDASALEDEVSKYVAGRQDTGGTWSVTFNLTDEVEAQLEAMITAYRGMNTSTEQMWFEVWSPYLTKGFWVVAQPPLHIPMPEESQNALQTVEMTFTIVEYKGMLTAVEPTTPSVGG